ncbi:MAG: PorV/PorQ family protein [Elusimicrobia bacterium]|nr:PorV/PorQ family protein [Elusimicrobiota bacterium]
MMIKSSSFQVPRSKLKKKKFFSVSLLVLLTWNLELGTWNSYAAFSSNDSGTASAQFLKLGTSARADALGGSYSAAGRDWSALFYNPALLARLPAITLGGTYGVLPGEISYSHGSWASPLGPGSLGINYSIVSYGSVQGYDESGFATTAFSPQDRALAAGWAASWPGLNNILSLGLSVKYLQLKITQQTTALAADAGAHLSIGSWSAAIVAQHMGTQVKYVQESFPLPLTLRTGVSLAFKKPSLAAIEMAFPMDQAPYAALGYEQRFWISPRWQAAARLGLSSEGYPQSRQGLALLKTGAGLILGALQVDYAYIPFGDLGLSHRMSVGYRFPIKERPLKIRLARPISSRNTATEIPPRTAAETLSLVDKKPGKSIAVIEFQSSVPLPDGIVNEMNQRFRQGLGKPKGYDVIEKKFTKEFIEITGLNVKDCRQSDCAQTITKALSVDQLFIGSVEASSQGYLVQVWLFSNSPNKDPVIRKAPAWTLDDLKLVANAIARSFLPVLNNK